MTIEPPLGHPDVVERAVRIALEEDRASEDITTLNTVPLELGGEATFLGKTPGVIAGWDVVREVFRQVDPDLSLDVRVSDGQSFERGATLAVARGPVRGLLQAERTALNFLQRMSGTATAASRYVAAIAGSKAVILDTRKTTPGMRLLEKYAVRCGGAVNHRADLASMAMIKDNHREALARFGVSLSDAVAAIRTHAAAAPVEIEIDSLDQLEEALAARPEWILLDNMPPAVMAEAVRRTSGRAKLEASGGITMDSLREVAESGVDAISVGALTHSAPALDISFDLQF